MERPMSNLLHRHWYNDGKVFIKKVDRWVSRRNSPSDVGQESDWLGWDGWVRPDTGPRSARDTTLAG